jgi:hypothetical protein
MTKCSCDKPIKIDTLKLFNSVKVGPVELTFLKSKDGWDVTLTGQIISIKSIKTGDESFTSLANIPYFTKLEDSSKIKKSNEPKKSPSSTKRVTKKKGESAPVA